MVPGPPVLFLVVDPRQNLLQALAEADFVERAWKVGSVVRLDQEQATHERMLAELSGADVLHFVGHADFSGRAGWDSGLALAEGARLTVPSLLTLDGVPRTVPCHT